MIAVKKKMIKATMALAVALLSCTAVINAQCAKFQDAPNPDDAESTYVIYRGDVKNKAFDEAFDSWKKAYENAPAADGKRFDVWYDGIEIYKHKLKTATGADADMMRAEIVKLYNEAIQCVENKTVIIKNCAEPKCVDKQVAFLAGRQAFDMFYTTNSPYPELFKALNTSVDRGGNNAEYIVLEPMAYVAVNQFAEKNIDKATTRAIYDKMNAIADYNIANNAKFKAYFESAKARMNAKFDEIAANIFDCDYWKVKVKPQYDANPNDPENLKNLISTLKRQACQSGDPFLAELEGKYASYAQQENAKRLADFQANNPSMMAKKAYDAGDYNGAIAKYQEAINAETDGSKKARYYLAIAGTYKKMNSTSKAMEAYRSAASANPNWGAPYISMGDLYVKKSRSCGKDAYDKGIIIIAALNMYRKAKSVDPNLAGDASTRISKYRASIPRKEDVFMRGKKKGDRVSVPCIGGSVSLEFTS